MSICFRWDSRRDPDSPSPVDTQATSWLPYKGNCPSGIPWRSIKHKNSYAFWNSGCSPKYRGICSSGSMIMAFLFVDLREIVSHKGGFQPPLFPGLTTQVATYLSHWSYQIVRSKPLRSSTKSRLCIVANRVSQSGDAQCAR